MMKVALLLLLRIYKLAISPFLGQNCRFYPSCSDYAAQAIREQGVLKGGALAVRRLCKCHPWHPGGFDPVPRSTAAHSKFEGTNPDPCASDTSDSSSAASCGCGHS